MPGPGQQHPFHVVVDQQMWRPENGVAPISIYDQHVSSVYFPPSHFNNLGYSVGKALVNHPQVITIFMVCYMFTITSHGGYGLWPLWAFFNPQDLHPPTSNLTCVLIRSLLSSKKSGCRAGASSASRKSWDDHGKYPPNSSHYETHGKWMKMGHAAELQMFRKGTWRRKNW